MVNFLRPLVRELQIPLLKPSSMLYFTFYLVLSFYLSLFTFQPNNEDGFEIGDPESLLVTLRRGYCLILNFREFVYPTNNRFGSELDVLALQKTFRQLGAEVRTCIDLTFQQVDEEVRALQLLD